MGKYVDLFMKDCADFALKICDKLDKTSHKLMAWAYGIKQKNYEKYGTDFDELF